MFLFVASGTTDAALFACCSISVTHCDIPPLCFGIDDRLGEYSHLYSFCHVICGVWWNMGFRRVYLVYLLLKVL